MSDQPQGPGWWQASDGRYYPPEAATRAEPPPSTPPFGSSQQDIYRTGPPPATSPPTSGKATAALVLSILSFFACPVIAAIVALVLASGAKREIASSYGRVGGEGMVKASRIISVINIVLFVLLGALIAFAIAVPTFFGARDHALDRDAQSNLRSAFTAEQDYRSETDMWTVDPAELAAIEPALQYEAGDRPVVEGIVYVFVEDTLVGLSARSESGTCFYLMSDSTDSSVGYAEDVDCGRTQDQDYQTAWD
ncbi:MAG: DUF4190 domain-containing protein [Actinobacteria bacterium]|nr:DUF4190 domain-containing protein [Actinomycetota bacterium]